MVLFSSIRKLDRNSKNAILFESIYRVTNNFQFKTGDQNCLEILGKANQKFRQECKVKISGDFFEIISTGKGKFQPIRHSRKWISCVELMDDVSGLIIFFQCCVNYSVFIVLVTELTRFLSLLVWTPVHLLCCQGCWGNEDRPSFRGGDRSSHTRADQKGDQQFIVWIQ